MISTRQSAYVVNVGVEYNMLRCLKESWFAGLMVTVSHQTFSVKSSICQSSKSNLARQIYHIYGYIINGNFIEFAKDNECLENF